MGARTAIQAAVSKIEDNSDYVSSVSLTKARLFIEGVQTLLVLRAAGQEKGGTTAESVRFDQSSLERFLRQARQWVAVNSAHGNGTTRQTMRCYRD